jgi:Spy/CpxP family protein refolding chaperone
MNNFICKIQMSKKIIYPFLLVGMMSSTAVLAGSAWGERGHHPEEKLEHLIDYLDLNEQQESQAELILSDLKAGKKDKKSQKGMHQLMSLNPGDSDYLEKVNAHAELVGAHVKGKIIQMAKAKQALYQILDDEQKEKMSKMTERRMKKIEKRLHRQDD